MKVNKNYSSKGKNTHPTHAEHPSSQIFCGNLAMKGKRCVHVVGLEGRDGWEQLWKRVVDPHSNGCCYIYSIGHSEEMIRDKRVHLEIPAGVARTVELRVEEKADLNAELEVIIAKGASFGLLIRGKVSEQSTVRLQVRSFQDQSSSHMTCRGRLVCMDGGNIDIETCGYVGTKAVDGSCVYDVKVLQSGRGGIVKVLPHLEILGKETKAVHGFSVGRVPASVLLYMQSRGIDEKTAEKLYVDGFLR